MEVKHQHKHDDWSHTCPGNGCRYPSCENNAQNLNVFTGLNWPGGIQPRSHRRNDGYVTKLDVPVFPPVNTCQPKGGYDPLYRRILQSENTLAKFHSRLRERV